MARRKKQNLKLEYTNGNFFINDVEVTEEQKNILRDFVFRHLFNGVSEKDFLVFDKNKNLFLIDGKKVSNSTLKIIKEQAKYIKNSVTFDLLLKEMKSVSHLRMFEKSETPNDLLAGKMMLYNIEVQKRKIHNLSQIEIPKNLEESFDEK